MAIFRITPATSIIRTGFFEPAFASGTPFADSLIVDPGAFLFGLGFAATGAELGAPGVWTATINGSVRGDGYGTFLHAGIAGVSTVTVGAEGSVAGLHGVGAASAITLKNSGEIGGMGGNGVWLQDFGTKAVTHTITNSGTISGTAGFSSILDEGQDNVLITNSGTLSGSVTLSGGNDGLTNSGTVIGDVVMGGGANKLSNSGQITSSVIFGSGNDTASNTKTIVRSVDLGDGTNVFTNSGSVLLDVTAGAGNDTLSNSAAGRIAGNLTLGGGANKLGNQGTLQRVFAFEGDDTVTNSGTILFLDLGAGKNSLVNSGSITGYSGGSGDDTITNTKDMKLNAALGYSVALGDGTNKLVNSGVIDGAILGGAGNDTISNTKTINIARLDEGDDAVTNSGQAFEYRLGNGTNKLTNSGSIQQVFGGSGSDTVTNSKVIGAIFMESGDDTVVNTGTIAFAVELGDGNDKYTGGSFADRVRGDGGADTISLGAGNDTYIASNLAGTDGIDVIDGGLGIDTYSAEGATVGSIVINLDTVAHAGAAAGQATGAPIAGAFHDKIKGFENATGAFGDDTLHGTSAANDLNGSAGTDHLYGYGGADRLIGSGGTDTFHYASTKDSGMTAATRDVITDFTSIDTIDLSAIDAKTGTPTIDDAFTYINGDSSLVPGVAFSGLGAASAGELRSYWTLSGHVIEGDVNGDGKGDFSIAILDPSHAASLTSASFIL